MPCLIVYVHIMCHQKKKAGWEVIPGKSVDTDKNAICEEIAIMSPVLQSTRVDWLAGETWRQQKDFAQILQLLIRIRAISFAVGAHKLTSICEEIAIMSPVLQSTKVDWLAGETWRQQKDFAQILQLLMWFRAISFAVGAHKLTSICEEIAITQIDVSLCAPTANDIARILINSWRICAKSFCCLQVSPANQSTLVLCRTGDIIAISSQIDVSLCAPTANDIARNHINSWRICAKSFCCLQVSPANQSTFVLCRTGDIIAISSQIDVSLCAPTANDIARIHINSWRICAKSFCCLQVSPANQSTLVLCRTGDIIAISSQIDVSLCAPTANDIVRIHINSWRI